MTPRLRSDTRGVSTLLSYILAMSLFSFFTLGLFFVGADVFANEQEQSKLTQLKHNGQALAHAIETVDRQARTPGTSSKIATDVSIADAVGGEDYHITIVDKPNEQYLLLETENTEISVRIPFVSETSVKENTISSRKLQLVWKPGPNTITIEPKL